MNLLQHLTFRTVLLGACATATGHAAVIQNGIIIYSQPPYGQIISLTPPTMPMGGGMFAISVTSAPLSQFTFQYFGIAEPYSVFLVEGGERFDADYVGSTPSFLNNSNNPGQGTITLGPGQSRYLAYWDDRTSPMDLPSAWVSEEDLYGWMRIANVGGTLVVQESATAVGGGIIVGTLQQVPEPSGLALAAMALSGTLIRRTRRK